MNTYYAAVYYKVANNVYKSSYKVSKYCVVDL